MPSASMSFTQSCKVYGCKSYIHFLGLARSAVATINGHCTVYNTYNSNTVDRHQATCHSASIPSSYFILPCFDEHIHAGQLTLDGLTLGTENRKLYYADAGDYPKIVEMNLDGSQPVSIVSKIGMQPRALVLDSKERCARFESSILVIVSLTMVWFMFKPSKF